MLHKTSEMRGYHIVATDGGIGHADDFLVDEDGWTLRYIVVDTSNWIGGRSVVIAASAIARIDSPDRKIYVTLTRDAVRNSPSTETADIDPAETAPALWIF
ncbi:MAG TPA: PRC-barrel domain-containing protein [Vicinamibacterales bacterium]|nr:PRC-barrel domain-containing protein [Vicinamibacterales bacterium]